jgi:hypothetical protein
LLRKGDQFHPQQVAPLLDELVIGMKLNLIGQKAATGKIFIIEQLIFIGTTKLR